MFFESLFPVLLAERWSWAADVIDKIGRGDELMSHDISVGYNTIHSLRHMTTYRHCISPTTSLIHRLVIGRHLTFREREKNESMHGNFNGQRSKKDIGYTARSFFDIFSQIGRAHV